MKFINFVLKDENSEEIKSIFDDLRNIILEAKTGYSHALELKNKVTNKTWISSTNDLEGREKDLKSKLKAGKGWYEPWKITFGNLTGDILSQISFVRYEDIKLVPVEKILQQFLPIKNLEDIKETLIKLLLKFSFEVKKISNTEQVRKIIDDHFKSEKKLAPLEGVIKSIDDYLDKNN